jgi:uncharacterized ferredoxin-like protein
MSNQPEKEALKIVAQLMSLAARTAPKARGRDNLLIKIVSEKEKGDILNKMEEIAEKNLPRRKTFLRDKESLAKAEGLLLIGTKTDVLGLDCGFCGFKSCQELKEKKACCVYVSGDLGIALGSAVAVAARHHLDNRIMYTIGYAAKKLKILGEEAKIIYGIPLSATGKNIFFDRKT